MIKSTICALLGICLLAAGTVRAAGPGKAESGKIVPGQADLATLIDTFRANRKAFIAVNLALPPEQAANFWPVYDRYQKEMNAVGDRINALIADYTASYPTLSNDKALQLMQDYLAAEADRLKVRRAYLDEFAKVVPGLTVARFYQIENKIDAVLRYDLAATIPVVQEATGAPAK
jgi:hypothetical protein